MYLNFYKHKSELIAQVLMNESTKHEIFSKSLNFTFFLLLSIMLMTVFQ
jgi:hypothetical protein